MNAPLVSVPAGLLSHKRTFEAVALMENTSDFGCESVTIRGVFFFHYLF